MNAQIFKQLPQKYSQKIFKMLTFYNSNTNYIILLGGAFDPQH